MNANEHKRPEQIESEIEQTRAEVSSTIDAIQRKLTPGQLMDQALDYFRHSGPADFSANLGRTIRDNPVPVALVGVGLAWLMMSGNAPRRTASHAVDTDAVDYGDAWPEVEPGGAGESALRRATHSASDMGHSVKDKAAELASRAGSAMSGARERITERTGEAKTRIHDLTGRSREQYERAKRSFTHMLEDQPLVLGALGVAVGAAIGASLPGTRKEDELMGRARDDLVESATETARAQASRVKESAEQVAQSIEHEAAPKSGWETRADAPPTQRELTQ